MAELTAEQVRHIADLARLELSEEQLSSFGGQLSGILGHIEKLNTLDTTGVEPTSHVIAMTNVVRADEPGASLSVEEALANAPDRSESFYRVPKIIE